MTRKRRRKAEVDAEAEAETEEVVENHRKKAPADEYPEAMPENNGEEAPDADEKIEDHNYSKDPKEELMRLNLPIYACCSCKRYTFDAAQSSAHARQVHGGKVGIMLMLPFQTPELQGNLSAVGRNNNLTRSSPHMLSPVKSPTSKENAQGRKYQCSKCGRQFDRERQMNMHKCMDIVNRRLSPRRGQSESDKDAKDGATSPSADATIDTHVLPGNRKNVTGNQSEAERVEDEASKQTTDGETKDATSQEHAKKKHKGKARKVEVWEMSESDLVISDNASEAQSGRGQRTLAEVLDVWEETPVARKLVEQYGKKPSSKHDPNVISHSQVDDDEDDNDGGDGDVAEDDSEEDIPNNAEHSSKVPANNRGVNSSSEHDGFKKFVDETEDGDDDMVRQWVHRGAPSNDEISRFMKTLSGGLQGGGGQAIEFYMCLMCRKVFKTRGMARVHVQSHLGYRPHVCPKCGFSTSQRSILRAHKRRHSRKGLKCLHKFCSFEGKGVEDLSKHRQEFHTTSLTCQLCPTILKSQSTMLGHLSIVHASEIKDGKGLAFYNEMVKKGRKSTQIVLFECDRCGHKTKTKKEYYTHVKIHTGGDTVCLKDKVQGLNNLQDPSDKVSDVGTPQRRERQRVKRMQLKGTESQKCPMCDFKCQTDYTLRSHLLTHPFVYRCSMCTQMFLTYGALNEHIGLHKDDDDFNPQEKINDSLRKSMYVGGQMDRALEADKMQWAQRRTGALAPQSAFTGTAFDELMTKISVPSEVVSQDDLQEMGSIFSQITYKQLTPSILRYLHLRFGNVECGVCGKLFAKVGLCKDHTKRHTRVKEFKCSKCPFKSNGKAFLQKHMVLEHDEGKAYYCDVCKLDMYSRKAFNLHMKKHSKENDGPFTCTWCNTVEEQREDMKKHIMATHPMMPLSESTKIMGKGVVIHREKGAPFLMCDVCNATFRRICDLRRHMWKHSNVKRFQCELCDYGSDKRSNIISHMRRHSTDKAYSCEICNKAYKTEQSVKLHIQSAHLKLRPHKCDMCDYAASQPVHLRRHKVLHHSDGEGRRFRCAICPDYKASDLQVVKRHYKKKHPEEQMNYSKCCPPKAQNPSLVRRDKHQVIQVVPAIVTSAASVESNSAGDVGSQESAPDASSQQEEQKQAEQDCVEQAAEEAAMEGMEAKDASASQALGEVVPNMSIEVVLPEAAGQILIHSAFPDVISALNAGQEADFRNQ
ncbi:uncharacterized protein [Diadema setosum]|uniref:uncharacterized protein n=1 Tax=Diadema setosum TaxID=31175 RepID=UPI003B3AB084